MGLISRVSSRTYRSENMPKSESELYYESILAIQSRYTEQDTEYQEYCKQRWHVLKPPVIHPWPPTKPDSIAGQKRGADQGQTSDSKRTNYGGAAPYVER